MPRNARERAALTLIEDPELSLPSDPVPLEERPVARHAGSRARPSRVEDVMTRRVVTVPADASLHEATRQMRSNHVSGLPVLDTAGDLVGIITETDVGRVLGRGPGASPLDLLLHEFPRYVEQQHEAILSQYRATLGRMSVREAMTPEPVTIPPEAPITAAVQRMREERVNRLPVVEGRKVVGIVARQDLLLALLPP